MCRWQVRARLALGAMAATSCFLAGATRLEGQTRPDSGAFIVRLGRDTVAIERWVRSGNTLRATGLTRSPRTTVRQYVVTFGPEGRVQAFATSTQGQAPEPRPVPVPGAIPLAGQLYVPYQLAVQQARRAGGATTNVVLLAGTDTIPIVVTRTGPGAFTLPNQFDATLQVAVDDAGRIRSVDAGGGTTVQRLEWVDIDAFVGEFRRRDDAGTGLGPLSPRDTATATVKGATINVDYSRPSLRGRPLSLLAPAGQVWRTGANDATHFRTDRELRFGSVSVPAGTYTLFTLPSASGWKLIINKQTGQGGLDYDESQDLARIDMAVRHDTTATEQFTIDVTETAEGGALRLRWGTMEAVAPFRVVTG